MDNKEAIEILKKHISPYSKCKADAEANMAIELAIKALEGRSQGEWIEQGYLEYECSVCGRHISLEDHWTNITKDFPFCHCGAAMSSDAAMSTNKFSHKCYTISRNKTTCDVCGAILEGNKE